MNLAGKQPSSGFVLTLGDLRTQAELAAQGERLGYESVWVYEFTAYDAVTALAAVASATASIRIGTAIVAIYLRDPLLMAMTANAVNEYCQGRLILGLGTSTAIMIEKWHGLAWTQPLSRMRQYIALVRRLLAGERVKAEGLYNLSGAQLTAQPSGPIPIYMAALNPKMLALAGELADGVILNFPTLTGIRRHLQTIQRAAQQAGRSPADIATTAFLRVTVTANHDAAVPQYRKELLPYILSPVYRRVFSDDGYGDVCDAVNHLWSQGDREAALKAISQDMVHDHAVIGPADYCASKIQEFRRTGLDNPILFPIPESDQDPLTSVKHTLAALAPKQ